MPRQRAGEEVAVSCSMKVLNWLKKRTKEEMAARGLASHSLVPPVDHCAVFINSHDSSGSAVEVLMDIDSSESRTLNKVYVQTDFDFDQVRVP
jgi:hypothetical protein